MSVTHSYEVMAKISIKETVCISSSIKGDRINTSTIVPASSKMSHSNTKEASPKTASSSIVSGKIISNESLIMNSHEITRKSSVSGSIFPKLRSLSISQSTSLDGLPKSMTVTPNEEIEEVYIEIAIKGDVKKVTSISSLHVSDTPYIILIKIFDFFDLGNHRLLGPRL